VSRSSWATLLLAVVGVICAVHFGWSFPWSRTFSSLADCNWALLTAAGLVNIISLAAKGGAWYLLLRQSSPLRLVTGEAATFIGAAVNSVSVAISGDVVRSQIAAGRDGVPFGNAVAAVIVSRVVEAAALVGIVGVAALSLAPDHRARLAGAAVLILVAGFSAWWSRAPREHFEARLAKTWRTGFKDLLGRMRPAIPSAVGCAMVSWLGQWLTYYWSLRATHVDLSLTAGLAALLVANFAGVLRLTPGNVGIMQASLIVGMRGFGIRPGEALAGGLALQAIQVLPVLAIATALVGQRGLRRISQRRSEVV
jgi:uncharacterized membrane protein YbhN (UPF0104 family)